MTKQSINVGTSANDRKGDSLRAAFTKVNNNFDELYTALGLQDPTLNLGAFTFTGSTMSTDDSTAIVIDKPITVNGEITVDGDITPSVANGSNLGSPTKPFRSLYVSNNTIFLGGTALSVNGAGNLTVNGSQVTGGSVSSLVNGANTVSLGSDGTTTFPDGYLKIVPNGANPYISNRTDNGLGLVSGSAIQIRQSVADAYGITIDSSDTNTVGTSTLAIGSSIDVNGNKIILGNYAVNYADANTGLTVQNKVEINNNEILIGEYVSTLAGGITTSTFGGWTFGTDGKLALPATGKISNSTHDWTFGTDGNLTIPGDIKSNSNINIDINLSDSTLRRWQFGEDGNLVVPGDINLSGGTISRYSQNGLTGLKLVANADQGQNVTIMGTGNNTFPILNYVGTTLSGITIGTPEGDWNFMNGNLTIPGDIRSDSNINIDINLADSTLRRWQFGEDGILTLPSTGKISNSGYDWTFGTDGALTLPNGAVIKDTAGNSVVFGEDAGTTSQGANAVAIGTQAGNSDQGTETVAIGALAGISVQGQGAVAVGFGAGYNLQGVNSVAIGKQAGLGGQGANAIAIGYGAGDNNQAANTIILNASGVIVNSVAEQPNSFYVAPIRSAAATANVVYYNTTTKEVTYGAAGSAAAGTLTGTALASGVVSSSLTSVGTLGTLRVTGAITADSFNCDQITIVGNRIATTVTNANLELECNGTGAITLNNNTTIASSSLTFSGNISAAAWTTSGIRHVSVPATLTDTTSSGTVANAYTNNFGGNTIAASNATTYTNYATVFLNDPTAGTNVTITNSFSLITAGNVKLGSTGTGTIAAVAATATTNSTAASVGYLGLPQSATATTATLAIGDAGKHIYVTTASQTITIPAASSVAYPIGTTITFIAGSSATTVSIAIATDTMYLAGTGTTGTRTLAAYGMATAVKVSGASSSGVWFINGIGLT
jgi:hypothetical protein